MGPKIKPGLAALLGGVLLIGLGEELWSKFIPAYLLALGGTSWMAAAYGTLRDLLDALYSYPGGWLNDRLGGRRALLLFTGLSIAGYLTYLVSPNGWVFLAGACLALAWTSFSMPALFDLVAKNLASRHRTWGFSLQAILKRVPVVLGPPLGGLLIAYWGLKDGFRIGLGVTVLLAAGAFALLRAYAEPDAPERPDRRSAWRLFLGMDGRLKALLGADCLIRLAEGIPDVFVVLYVMEVLRRSAFEFGALMALQMGVSILLYLPVARLAGKMDRKPWVLLTFCFFALYPLALIHGRGMGWLALAFIVGGLREVGEPARKAMIADLADPKARGRVVGLYYFIRGLAVFPASLLGGWLWMRDVRLPFEAAYGFGLAGFLYFLFFGRDLGPRTGRIKNPSK